MAHPVVKMRLATSATGRSTEMTRAPAACAKQRTRGFTLLEIMVVIVIVAVIVSLAVISLGDNAGRRLDEEARRVRTLLRLAADEAVLQGHEIGVVITADGYEFQIYDDRTRQWARMPASRLFRPRKMPDGVRLELFLDDQALVLPVGDDEQPDGDDDDSGEPLLPQPQLLLLSSGEITPFELELAMTDVQRKVLVRGSPNGAIEEVIGER